MTENVGTRYLFDKNETGLTLEDNLISTLDWDMSKRGHLQAFEYAGGNYIKLTKIPKGIKVYWNTKNDRAGAMLLDDVNRGVKVSKQNKWGQLMAYRNYYLWSEGTLAEDETNPHIILEFTGKGVEVEYLVGSATEIQLLADQFNALNQNLNKMVESLAQIEVSSSATATANALEHILPKTLIWSVQNNATQTNKIPSNLRPTIQIINHINHYHINYSWSPTQTVSANLNNLVTNINTYLLAGTIGQLVIKSNMALEYTIRGTFQVGFQNIPGTTSIYHGIVDPAQARGLQSLTQDVNGYNFYTVAEGSNLGSGLLFTAANKGFITIGGVVSGLRLLGNNVNNYAGISLTMGNTVNENVHTSWLALVAAKYASYIAECSWQMDLIVEINRLWLVES